MARPAPAAVPDGLFNLDKPTGRTSRDLVNQLQRLYGRRARLGHAGTLDPLASGVLVIASGRATRLIEYVQRMPKTYRATVRLGVVSDTDDADGTVSARAVERPPTRSEIESALASQVGWIDQVPPAYSALKVAGRRSHELARSGETVKLDPRPVRIDAIRVLGFDWPRLELEVECGAGTYIRSIARDLGEVLGCGGLIEALRRSRIGVFMVEDAFDLDDLVQGTASPEEARALLASLLRPPRLAVGGLPEILVDDQEALLIAEGRELRRPVPELPDGTEAAIVAPGGNLVAIAEARGGRVQPRRVLAPSRSPQG